MYENDTKIPKSPYGYGNAKVNDPSTWADYPSARKTVTEKNYTGIGLILTNGICGIDIDAKKNDINDYAEEILDRFSDTYIEKSPSGKGYHILCLCDDERLPIMRNNSEYPILNKHGKYTLDGYSLRNDALELEIYPSKITNRYFTFTENTVNNNPIIDKTEDVIWFFKNYMNDDQEENCIVNKADAVITKARNACSGKKFSALFDDGDKSEYNNDDSRADLALCSMLAYWCKGDHDLIRECFEKSALVRNKWLSREDYRENTINMAIQNQIKPFTEYIDSGGKRIPLTIDALEAWLDSNNITIKYNEITHEVIIHGLDKMALSGELIDTSGTIIFDKIKSMFKTNQSEVINYLKVIYLRHSFNPISEFLAKQEPWDKVDRVSELYKIMRLEEDDTLSRSLIHKWLKMAYALSMNRIENPFGSDGILVLQGEQGIGKSMLCSRIGINGKLSKTGLHIDTRNKDTIIRATSCFIGELGEIGSTLRSDLDRLKAFITEAVDRYRIPYGRTDVNVVRRSSFIATTNDDRFLLDPTGSRRFWTVKCNHPFDLEALNKLDIGQLWKQIEYEMSSFEYSTKHNSPFQNAFRLSYEERMELELRNGVLMKLIKSEQEVTDILDTAENQPSEFEWKKTTVTMWKSCYLALSRFSAEDIGKVLQKKGIQTVCGRINGVAHNNCYLLPFRITHHLATDSNDAKDDCGRDIDWENI